MSERIDKVMVEKELVKTRSQARMLIKQGDVLCNGKKVSKPGVLVNDNADIQIKERGLYVSRGAYKLLKAIEDFDLSFAGKVVADCGASTGGFTQVALQKGANKVYAIDVGHDQLDEILRINPLVTNMEGVNLKHPFELPEKVDICVTDISFISLTKVYPTIHSLLKPNGFSIVLIKPQFEAGPKRIARGGLVKPEHLGEIVDEVRTWFKDHNFVIDKFCESPITGKTGNVEYLALIRSA